MAHSSDGGNEESGTDEPVVNNGDDVVNKIVTVGAITVVAALFEAALIPGMIIGVGAMLVPSLLPKAVAGVDPAMRHLVRSAYRAGRRAQSAFAEAKETVNDIVAETEAEGGKQS